MFFQFVVALAISVGNACPQPAPLQVPDSGTGLLAPAQMRMTTRADDTLDPERILENRCDAFRSPQEREWPSGERSWVMLNPSGVRPGQSWGLRLPASGFLDFCVLWPRTGGDWQRDCVGTGVEGDTETDLRVPDFIAPTDLDTSRPVLITGRSPFRARFPVQVGRTESLMAAQSRELLFTGAAYGTLTALVAYGLLLLGGVRSLSLLYFSAYVGLFTAGLFVAEDLHARWFGWVWPALTLHGPYLLLGASFLAGTLFLGHFLHQGRIATWADTVLWCLGLAGGGLMLVAGLHLDWALIASDAGALIFASGALALSIEGVRTGKRNAGPLLVGFVLLLLALLLNSLVRIGWLPSPGVNSIDLLKFGLLAGGLSLGFGIQREFSALRRQRDRASLLADTHERIALYRSEFDATTGLPGRRRFFKLVSERVATAGDRGLGVLIISLDDFRRLRHVVGQERSDDLLRALVRRLQALESGGRVLGQTESDEFTLLMPLPTQQSAAESLMDSLAGEVRTRVNEPFPNGDRVHRITASMGGSLFPMMAKGGEALLLQAEAAVFEAREAGGNRFCLYGRSDEPDIMERWNMRDRLAAAIREGQLDIEFQPIVKLGSRQIQQFEALARWDDPELGDVPPSVFIEVAEAFGLIETLGRDIMTRACRQLADWRRQGLAMNTGMSLNLSPLQLRNDGFETWFCAMLDEQGLHPADIHLEVTETVLVENLATAKAQLGRLSRRGMGISVDDFGVGYSSLSYIRELPIDILKIDRSFIARLDQSVAEREIVRSILDMARKLELTVVAEGIETAGQAAFLGRHGCQLGQGFLFGRPSPASTMDRQL